ncbi:MAG: DNA primase [Alphaproteobacteria bacterium]|nr:DNA primase [Alphaproteobacteria bacterium]
MARIPRDVVDAVRDRTDIVEVISRHVTLSKSGKDLKGLCPFHQEKSPSFHVVPSKGIYHCFGCQAGGDVFRFLMQIEGLSFSEAVRELAGPAGVMIEERELTATERVALRSRATMFDVLEEAASFYESTLWTHPDGQPGRDYLKQRELSDAVCRRARIGFAPEGWTRLLDHLHRKGYRPEQALAAGLARPRKARDGYNDAFRARLMFPIRDERGRVIGFGGRLLEGDGPKYINTTETDVYKKNRVLYGLETARAAIQRADRAIVVEGYFDVLAMQEGGFDEAIATCGTAVTPDHIERLRRMTRNVVLVTDSDKAGQDSAERALPLLLAADVHGFRVELPGAKDPDEFLRAHGAEALAAALDRRQSLVEWVVGRKVREYADQTSRGLLRTADASERIIDELRPLLGRLHPRQLAKIAGLLGVSEVAIRREVEAQPGRVESPRRGEPTTGWKPDRDIVHIFWLLVHCYDQVADLLQRVPVAIFATHQAVMPAMARLLTGEPAAAVIADEADDGVRRTLLAVVARQGLYEPEMAARGVCDMLLRLIQPRLAARTTWVQRALDDSERSGVGLRELLTERQSLKHHDTRLRKALQANDFGQFVSELEAVLDFLGTELRPAPPPAKPSPAPPPPAADPGESPVDTGVPDGWLPPDDDGDEPPPMEGFAPSGDDESWRDAPWPADG